MMCFRILKKIASVFCVLILSGCGGGDGGENNSPTVQHSSLSSRPTSSMASVSSSSTQSEYKDLTVYVIANKKFINGSFNGHPIHATKSTSDISNLQFFTGPVNDRTRYLVSQEGVLKEMLMMDFGHRLTMEMINNERVEYKIYAPNLKFSAGAVLYYENNKWMMGQLTTEIFESYEKLTHKTNVTEYMQLGLSKYSAISTNLVDTYTPKYKFSLFQEAEADMFETKFLESVIVGIGAAAFTAAFPPIAGYAVVVGISAGIFNYATFNINVYEKITNAVLKELLSEAKASDEIVKEYYLFTSPTEYSEISPNNPSEQSSSSAIVSASSTSGESASSIVSSLKSASSSEASSIKSSISSSSAQSVASISSSSNSSGSESSQSSSFRAVKTIDVYETFIRSTAKECVTASEPGSGGFYTITLYAVQDMPGTYIMPSSEEHTINIPGFLKIVNTFQGITTTKSFWFDSNGLRTATSATDDYFGCSWLYEGKGDYLY